MQQFMPNCLIYRYAGSDMLEAALIMKEGKKNMHVATRPEELDHPVAVRKCNVYQLDPAVYEAINNLRSERKATMAHYDAEIQTYWQKLVPFNKN